MRLHRLIAILLLLETREKIKAKELASALETSIRSIQRDINVLSESGIPVFAETGPNGGYSLMPGYSSNLNTFHHDELLNLYLCGIGIRMDDNTDTGLNLKKALLKLEKNMPGNYSGEILKVKKRFYFDSDPWWKKRPGIDNFDLLRKSVLKSLKIKFYYTNLNNVRTERIVMPYGLVVKEMLWYLIAFCEKRNGMRVFSCHRIKEPELLNENFKIPGDFSLEEFWHKKSGSYIKEVTAREQRT